MKHRADIEGLRGVAVLLVVLAHAGVPGLQGGFIGVDVFFVISGYLITGLLLEELRANGRINGWRFYARRVRRLLPGFAAMLVVVMVVAAVVLAPAELANHAREGAWAAAWAANLYQVVADVDYFDTTREAGLFLHAWSLGVEEQFYLLWPLLLWLAWRMTRDERSLRVLLAVAAIGGLVYAVHMTQADPLAAYFLPQVRGWQFALGAVAFLYAGAPRASRRGAAAGIAGGGLAAIVVAAAWIERDTAYPGFAALAPSLGAAAVLVGGAIGSNAASRALGSSAPAALGRISYGWYLWHWPALVFASELAPEQPTARAIAALGSIAVAWVTFHVIEDPIRKGRRGEPRTVALLGVLASLCLVVGCVAISRIHESRLPHSPGSMHPIKAAATKPSIYSDGCDQWYRSAALTPCEYGAAVGDAGTIVMVGDSIGLQWFPALDVMARDQRRKLVVLTKSACPLVDRPFHYERIRREYTECADWRDAVAEYIRTTAPSIVVLGSAGNYPFDASNWRDGSRDFLRRISGPQRRLVVLGPTPVLPFRAPTCLMRLHDGLPPTPEVDACSVPLDDVRLGAVEDALREAVSQVPGAIYLPMAPVACPDARCAAWRVNRLAFRDDQHLDAGYAEALAPELAGMLAPLLPVDTASAE